MNKVTLNTFKESGKWYDTIEYVTEIESWKTPELIEEAKTKAQSDMDFTMHVEDSRGGVNWRLVKIDRKIEIIKFDESTTFEDKEELKTKFTKITNKNNFVGC